MTTLAPKSPTNDNKKNTYVHHTQALVYIFIKVRISSSLQFQYIERQLVTGLFFNPYTKMTNQ